MKIKLYLIIFFTFISMNLFAENKQVATITKLVGKVYLGKVQAKVGDVLSVGDELSTDSNKDVLEISYRTGHKIQLRGGKLRIQHLTESKNILELLSGTLYNLVKKLNKEEFIVNTKRASFAVRGTKFYIQENEKESYLCVCEGVVKATKENKSLDVKIDEDLFVSDEKPYKVTVSSQMMRDMGNEIFNAMEK